MLAEVRMARIVEAVGLYKTGKVTCEQAAEWLGVSERHFRRLRDRYEAEGAEGIVDRRRGRASGQRAPVDQVEWVIDQFMTRYFDFNVKHFHEEIAKRGFVYSYSWTKMVLCRSGLVRPKRRLKNPHRKKRVRRPLPGMMLFQDGSTHEWLIGRPPLDLIVTLDDATAEVYSIFLVAQEGTASTFRGLTETIAKRGLFSSFYTDRGSHYFFTPKAGEKVSKTQLTQVGRALAELGIRHMPSYSPEARGRMERVWGTLQGRLPALLRLEEITTLEAANRFLAETYLAEHNARFAVAAAEEGTAFVPFVGDLAGVLCSKHERQVGNDNCVRFGKLDLQIPEQTHRRHYVRVTVEVRQFADGSISIFHGPRRLADYTADGTPIDTEVSRQSAA
jgi:transposase